MHDRLQRKKLQTKDKTGEFFRVEDWIYVFAALGDLQNGSSLEEVSKKTRLPIALCEAILHEMLKKELIQHFPTTGKYRAQTSFLNFEDLGQSDSYKNFYKSAYQKVGKRIETKFEDPHSLFFTSVFSIKKSALSKVASELQKALADFSETHEDAHGDDLALIQLGMINTNS